jgi:hypothetical protein
MKKISTLILMLCSLSLTAQDDSTAKNFQFKFGVNYNSNLNYYGRTDVLKSSGFFPLAEFWVSPKFYINAAPVFVSNAVQKMDYAGTVATAGFQSVSEEWFVNAYAMKPFYEPSAQLVQSALKAQAGLLVSKLNKLVNVSIGADVKFSDKVDFGGSAGLDHAIRFEKNNTVFVINPSITAFAGTQQLTGSYTRKNTSVLGLPAGTESGTISRQTFNILAYEASIPLVLVKGRLTAMATPSYVIPQNLIVVKDHPELSEQGENTFYITLGLKYSF